MMRVQCLVPPGLLSEQISKMEDEPKQAPSILKFFPYSTVGILGIIMAFKYELVEDWMKIVSEFFELDQRQTIALLVGGVVVAMVLVQIVWSTVYYFINRKAARRAAELLYTKERNALMAIFNSMDGKLWRDKTRWGSSEPVERWKGVKINPHTGRVYKLILPENNLGGMYHVLSHRLFSQSCAT